MRDRGTESCLSCKLISVGCFVGIGGYLMYQGKMQPKYKQIYYSLGIASALLGVGEIFDKSPFRMMANIESKGNE